MISQISPNRPAPIRERTGGSPLPVQRVADFLAQNGITIRYPRIDEHIRADRHASHSPNRVVVGTELDFDAVDPFAKLLAGEVVPRRVHASHFRPIHVQVRVALVKDRQRVYALRGEAEVLRF